MLIWRYSSLLPSSSVFCSSSYKKSTGLPCPLARILPQGRQNRHFRNSSYKPLVAVDMAESDPPDNKQSWAGPAKKRFGKKLTHFLCFPLLSQDVLQPFGSSLEHFRDITTTPAREHPLKARQRTQAERQQLQDTEQAARHSAHNDESESIADEAAKSSMASALDVPQNDPLGNITKSTGETFEESLKIIPSISHRPLGTYHLTIGVMDLAEQEDYQKCEDIFNSLDLEQLLADAEKGPPSGAKVARKWKHDNRQEQEEAEQALSQEVDRKAGLEPEEADIKDTSATHPTPMHISLLGLGAFNSPRRARVLFARPYEQKPRIAEDHQSRADPTSAADPSKPLFDSLFPDRLCNFALHIEAPFRAAGLIKETRPLTLHATLVNIRHKMQAKGGRTSKGKAWTHGRKRWDDNCVDASLLCKLFNEYSGDIEAAKDDESNNDDRQPDESKATQDDRDRDESDHSKEYLWVKDIPVNRIALCELGAKKSNDEYLGLEYPPVLEKWIFERK